MTLEKRTQLRRTSKQLRFELVIVCCDRRPVRKGKRFSLCRLIVLARQPAYQLIASLAVSSLTVSSLTGAVSGCLIKISGRVDPGSRCLTASRFLAFGHAFDRGFRLPRNIIQPERWRRTASSGRLLPPRRQASACQHREHGCYQQHRPFASGHEFSLAAGQVAQLKLRAGRNMARADAWASEVLITIAQFLKERFLLVSGMGVRASHFARWGGRGWDVTPGRSFGLVNHVGFDPESMSGGSSLYEAHHGCQPGGPRKDATGCIR